jgi:hypothetical protein
MVDVIAEARESADEPIEITVRCHGAFTLVVDMGERRLSVPLEAGEHRLTAYP